MAVNGALLTPATQGFPEQLGETTAVVGLDGAWSGGLVTGLDFGTKDVLDLGSILGTGTEFGGNAESLPRATEGTSREIGFP